MAYPEPTDPKAIGKALCVEANNPDKSINWKFLWEFDEEDWIKTQSLLDDLNLIHAPIQLRIVPNKYN